MDQRTPLLLFSGSTATESGDFDGSGGSGGSRGPGGYGNLNNNNNPNGSGNSSRGRGPADLGHLGDHHAQFCHLVGVRPLNHPPDETHKPHPESLYRRAVKHRSGQNRTYMFTATLVNTLLLTQVVLGAALTGLGASNSSRVLITVFGALNTVIAGVVAFLKSRGQPMRARMFRDDLERVVDEIENSAVMWFGISKGAHGYDAIDTDDQVTVRGEVARLTRLYDKAVKTNTMNDPDMYSSGHPKDSQNSGLRKPAGAAPAGPTPAPAPASNPAPVAADLEAGPASKPLEPSKPNEEEEKKDDADVSKSAEPSDGDGKDETAPVTETSPTDDKGKQPAAPEPPIAAAPAAVVDPDESPASAAVPPKREESPSKKEPMSPDVGKT